jgi:hypothetical protein
VLEDPPRRKRLPGRLHAAQLGGPTGDRVPEDQVRMATAQHGHEMLAQGGVWIRSGWAGGRHGLIY